MADLIEILECVKCSYLFEKSEYVWVKDHKDNLCGLLSMRLEL
jgi:Zn ribbon nucleic-acid-binding protein